MTLKNVLTKVVSRAIIDKHSKKEALFEPPQNRLSSGKRRGSGVKALSRKDRSQREQDDRF